MRAKYLGSGEGKQPEEISAIIAAVIEGATVDVDLRHGELVETWRSWAPGDWAFGEPIGVREGTLVVAVPDGATATLLQYQKTSLLAAVEERFGRGLLTSVRLRVDGSISARNPSE